MRLSLSDFGIALTLPTIGDQRGVVCYVIVIAYSIDLAALIQITERDETGAGWNQSPEVASRSCL